MEVLATLRVELFHKVNQLCLRRVKRVVLGFELVGPLETAEHIGIRRERAANYRHDSEGTEKLYCAVSATVASYRKNASVDDNWAEGLNEEEKK